MKFFTIRTVLVIIMVINFTNTECLYYCHLSAKRKP
ncbi:MAG TPA: hypothetical protein DCY14_01915 [Anaerolineae bacterium]|nr:hypothetical protein [Anaerolineae bacterium]